MGRHEFGGGGCYSTSTSISLVILKETDPPHIFWIAKNPRIPVRPSG